MKNISRIVVIVAVLSFATAIIAAPAHIASDQAVYNVLVRTDGRTEAEILAELTAGGVPLSVAEAAIDNLNISQTTSSDQSNSKRLAPAFGVGTTLWCVPGQYAQSHFEASTGAVSSVLYATPYHFGQGAFCADFDGTCAYTHLAGASTHTIYAHRAEGNFIHYLTNPGACYL